MCNNNQIANAQGFRGSTTAAAGISSSAGSSGGAESEWEQQELAQDRVLSLEPAKCTQPCRSVIRALELLDTLGSFPAWTEPAGTRLLALELKGGRAGKDRGHSPAERAGEKGSQHLRPGPECICCPSSARCSLLLHEQRQRLLSECQVQQTKQISWQTFVVIYSFKCWKNNRFQLKWASRAGQSSDTAARDHQSFALLIFDKLSH